MGHTGENVVRIEAEALRALADRIAGPMAAAFQCAVQLMFSCSGRVVVTGMGKSGLIARKIAATLIAMTGDEICGDLHPSGSGNIGTAFSEEQRQSPHPVSQRTRDKGGAPPSVSTLAAAAEVALDCSIAQEACSLGLAPTASTTTMLALGDALAVTLSERRGFKEEDFANLHP